MRYRLAAAFAVAFVASVTPAMASVEVGLLECRGVSQQYIVGVGHQYAMPVPAVLRRPPATL